MTARSATFEDLDRVKLYTARSAQVALLPIITVVFVAYLLIGRAMLGVAESAIITGALSWGLARLGAENTGRVMSWVGTALWGAFAAGAPAGSALYAGHGFAAIAIATTGIPLATLLLVAR